MSIVFLLLILWILLTDFYMVNPPCVLKRNLIAGFHLRIFCGKTCVYVHEKCFWVFFLVMSLSVLLWQCRLPISWQYFPLFCFWKRLCRFGIISSWSVQWNSSGKQLVWEFSLLGDFCKYEFNFFNRYRSVQVIYSSVKFSSWGSFRELVHFTYFIEFADTELVVYGFPILFL